MERDDELPFDELDPCCQREILDRRKYNEISSQLRRVDRSEHRHDLREGVVMSRSELERKRFQYCQSCAANVDYSALNRLRHEIARAELQQQADEERELSHQKEDVHEDEEEEDSDDEFLRELEAQDKEQRFQQIQEQQRLQQAQHQLKGQLLQQAETYFGLGRHCEDALEHLCQLTEAERVSERGAPLLIHFYRPTSILCATMDLALEELVRDDFPGLRARRIALQEIMEDVIQGKPFLKRSKLGNLLMTHRDTLRILRDTGNEADNIEDTNGVLVCLPFTEGGVGHEVGAVCRVSEACVPGYIQDTIPLIKRFVDRAGVSVSALHAPTVSSLRFQGSEDEVEEGGSAAEDTDYYDCGMPGCRKTYPHEHVTRENNASFVTAKQQQGAEMLSKNAFTKL